MTDILEYPLARPPLLSELAHFIFMTVKLKKFYFCRFYMKLTEKMASFNMKLYFRC